MGGIFQREKSLSEIEEETEQLEAENKRANQELSLAEKKVAIAQLKERGLTPKHFSFNWAAIKNWLKTH